MKRVSVFLTTKHTRAPNGKTDDVAHCCRNVCLLFVVVLNFPLYSETYFPVARTIIIIKNNHHSTSHVHVRVDMIAYVDCVCQLCVVLDVDRFTLRVLY